MNRYTITYFAPSGICRYFGMAMIGGDTMIQVCDKIVSMCRAGNPPGIVFPSDPMMSWSNHLTITVHPDASNRFGYPCMIQSEQI